MPGAHAKADLITISAFTVIADVQIDAVTLVRHTVKVIYCEELPKVCIHMCVKYPLDQSHQSQLQAQSSTLTTHRGKGYFRNLDRIG